MSDTVVIFTETLDFDQITFPNVIDISNIVKVSLKFFFGRVCVACTRLVFEAIF